MTLTYPTRLLVERRLLAALFLWPRAVELEPRHFLAPEHGALFEVLEEARVLFPSVFQLPAETTIYDDCSVPIVVGLARDYARRGALGEVPGVANDFGDWTERYLAELLYERVTQHAIDDLVEQVRECPRCGR